LVEQLFFNVTFSHLIAFFTANIFSYFMNSLLTFKTAISWFYYLRFLMASMLSLGLTLLLSYLMDLYGFHYLVGFIFIVLLVPLFNFMCLKFWAFSGGSAVKDK
jgi:putative flippase GtrA